MLRVFLILLVTLSLYAYHISDSLQIRAFGNADVIVSDTDNIASDLVSGRSILLEENDPNYDYSLIGAQLDYKINNYLSVMAQGIYGVQEYSSHYETSLEWALLGIDLSHNYKLNLGKMKVPYMKYTEVNYIGYSYLWQRPQLIDGVNGFDELYGASLRKSTYIDDIDLTFQFTGGQAQHEETSDENKWIAILSAEANYEGSSLRLAYGEARFDHILPDGLVKATNTSLKFGSIETEIHLDNLSIYAGFAKNENTEIPNQMFYYGSLAYSFGIFTPYYLHSYSEVTSIPNRMAGVFPPPRDGYEKFTINAVGMRYDVFEGLALKTELSLKDIKI